LSRHFDSHPDCRAQITQIVALQEAEDKLKAYFDKRGESLGGEFFLIDEIEILPGLIDAAGSRRLSMKA